MKLRHTIYNSIGLGVAGICALLWLGKVLLLMRMNSLPNRHPVDFIVSFILLLMTVVLVGGGGVANLTSGRLQPRATTVMVIAYFLTIIFIPLGIWGVIELQSCREARRRYRGGNHGTPDSAIFSRPLLRWMATASWAGPAGGFVLAVLCASTHHRPLVLVAALTFLLVVMASLILGAVALVLAISRQDKQGILVPAIIGISVSALIILLLLIAVVAGVFKFRQKHRAATPSVAAVGGAHSPGATFPAAAPSRSRASNVASPRQRGDFFCGRFHGVALPHLAVVPAVLHFTAEPRPLPQLGKDIPWQAVVDIQK